MKEIEKVSIGGYAFMLEKDALTEVERYLEDLEAHYLSKEGGKEIMEGIEERMAELLLERCGRNGVATLSDVRGIIDILGRPERIEADDPEPDSTLEKERPGRKLYRDLENKRIAGVCAGLGSYFGLDVSMLRIVAVVITAALFLGGMKGGVWSLSGFVFYAILWLAIPPARTAQERWAMKGDSGTLDDIQRNVRNGIEEMGAAARKGVDEVRDAVQSRGGRGVGRVFLGIIGVALLLAGVAGFASVTVLGLKGTTLFSAQVDRFLNELSAKVPVFYDLVSTPWVVTLAILAFVLPMIGLIYGGMQMIFGFKPPKWRPGLVIFVCWLIVLVVLAVLFFLGLWSADYLHF